MVGNNAIGGTLLRGNYTESLFFRAPRLHLLLIIILEGLIVISRDSYYYHAAKI